MNAHDTLLKDYKWCREITNIEEKLAMGRSAAAMAKDGNVIGVGTGSSSYMALVALAEVARRSALQVKIISAATEITLACASLGLETTTLLTHSPDWCMDGADEIGENGDVIKGRGGGLFLEKLIIRAAPRRFLLADETKFVKRIGASPVPVEVFPDALHNTVKELEALEPASITLRLATAKDGPIITQSGNLILDCAFPHVEEGLERAIKSIPGVIESGLFQNYSFEYIRP